MSNVNKIKEMAENRIRLGGYGAFSFREIAKDIGIKSSSVHYHFPTKEDLAVAVTRDYTKKVMALLNQDIDQLDQKQRLLRYIDLFRASIIENRKMCLCGMLAAEADEIPDTVKIEVQDFFGLNIDWLAAVFESMDQVSPALARCKASAFIATLEGGLLMARVTGSNEIFEQIVGELLTAY